MKENPKLVLMFPSFHLSSHCVNHLNTSVDLRQLKGYIGELVKREMVLICTYMCCFHIRYLFIDNGMSCIRKEC